MYSDILNIFKEIRAEEKELEDFNPNWADHIKIEWGMQKQKNIEALINDKAVKAVHKLMENSNKEAKEIFIKHWTKKTGTPPDALMLNYMQYCIDAMIEFTFINKK